MNLPKRKLIRLKNYDYSRNGAYFITICTHNRECLFGEIVVGEGFPLPNFSTVPNVRLNNNGQIINEYIGKISSKYTSIKIDKYVIMPNHIHLIILINNNNPQTGTGNPSPTIGNIIGWFKYQSTKNINELHGSVGLKLWQRSYHDHIIRNEKDYLKIWEYIDTNPQKWELDCYYID